MADADRDSDLGDDSPVSARSEGESSGDQSCESSDEGVGRDVPAHQSIQHQQHQAHQPMPIPPQHNMNHHTANHIQMNTPQLNHHPRNAARPHDREIKVRDDFESLKTSLHPHLSSLASLAQGAPLSTPNSVFAMAGGGPTSGFPYAPPAFLAPAPPPPAQPAGSASSSSSEGSAAGWSFEEQYKQVRQLYEISDDPGRKEFLDDLFSYMQKRGTPINRLPIMAKSVLDLYELFNLVVARGGLVEVINKKLWQEIIKGLRLPSSITSAAFTLRTQYMKYLYEYECDRKGLSSRDELEVAIEGNKREGRRSSGQYEAQAALAMQPMSRAVPATLAQLSQHMQPLPLTLAGGVAGMARMPAIPPHPAAHIAPHELEYRVREYMKMLQQQQREIMRNEAESPPSTSSAPMMSPRDAVALSALDASRMMWSLYSNNNNKSPQPDLEPQREALNLSESPGSTTSGGKREATGRTPEPAAKRRPASPRSPTPGPAGEHSTPSTPSTPNTSRASTSQARVNGHRTPPAPATNGGNGAAFKITTRGDATTGDQQLDVSIELNGVTYEGVLFPSQGDDSENSHSQLVS